MHSGATGSLNDGILDTTTQHEDHEGGEEVGREIGREQTTINDS